ncbi:MAG TPA: hypothetical protein PLZ36_17070, partial [Armatimonadota bacterium]|nr:hypothetical protein [Armatimonadota bacterium]
MRSLVCILIAACCLLAAVADTPALHGPSPDVQAYHHSPRVEIYRLRLINDADGAISGSRDAGNTWEPIGHVVTYTTKVSDQGYTASKWAPVGAVAATAVNAIHLRVGYNAKADKGIVFSILPKELTTAGGAKLQSYLSPDSSIYTDIPGGTGIFGGHWAPILGNPVYLEEAHGLRRLPDGYRPQQGDVLVITVMEPADLPQAIIFDNRFGGFITAIGWDGAETRIGQVLKPVAGVGRFTGTQYAAAGRLRANHNGVIDISTSVFGTISGFQIIPREHAMSPEMVRARTMTQWMVIGPLDARDPSWEGVAPLFRDYLRPSWAADDIERPDWLNRLA